MASTLIPVRRRLRHLNNRGIRRDFVSEKDNNQLGDSKGRMKRPDTNLLSNRHVESIYLLDVL